MLRKLAIGIVVVLAALVGALFILPTLIPEDVYRTAIENNAERTLNRDVTLSGPISASAFPSIQARAGDVAIANAEGFSAPALANVGELRAKLALLPLLSRRVEITEFVLVNPSISLEVAADGSNNWTFSEGGASSSGSSDAPRQPGALPFDAAFGDVRIVNGEATFSDRAAGVSHTISALNVRADMPALSDPLSVDADMQLDGEPVSIELTLNSLRSFFEGEASPFTANLDAGSAVVEVDGAFVAGQQLEFSGNVRLASNDVRALAARVGAELPEGDIYNQFDVSGQARGSVERVVFENAQIEFDRLRATGGFAADFSGSKPLITGDLAFGALDVTPYLTSSAGTQGGGGGSSGWSEEPLDLDVLRAVDANFSATAQSISADRFEFGESTLTAVLRNGRLEIDIAELNAYQGSGQAEFVVDGSGATPQVAMSADLANIQAEPFLNAAARFSRLAGAGSGRVNLTGAGGSQADIMRSLDGAGSFDFANGTLRGVNLLQAMRDLEALSDGRVQLSAFGSGATTTFTELAGQFTVEDGIARVRDFEIDVENIRVPISGALDIGGQSLDIRLAPQRINPTGSGALSGIGVPLRIQGSWGSVSAGVDQDALGQLLAAAARNEIEGQIGDALGDALGDDPTADVLRGVLGLPGRSQPQQAPQQDAEAAADGADQSPEAAQDDAEEIDPAQQLLRGLFGNDN